ncbi:hypothetical protein DCAR_0625453 [Daucus carota subsp. sativus]|uniref:CUE domain-containing protein n=1 Tax=Daucus carota subsp. sativus TaxID=79200 RepID=A0A161ZXC1_DAUCS|nr:PREDICTED: uncharacterized protein LOC108224983 [Daucus carota subsp. sativus]WOH06030.1 hypothetical protein DCAR_0625453 [Daucus carota subsp. sativus]
MSAVVCGKRSYFFEDTTSSSPPASKRTCFSSNSPARISPPRSNTVRLLSAAHLDHLAALFPDMDKQLLEKALESCGDDLDAAIKSLTELHLESAIGKFDPVQDANVQAQIPVAITSNGEDASSQNPSNTQSAPMDGAEWVELFVREMGSASDMNDARNRASRALEFLEKSIRARATAETAKGLQQENNLLKEQLQALIQENVILKRAVSIQHERQKEFEGKSQELHNLKQLASQYQEQLRTLEVNNYALTLHLKQAQQSNSLPGHFHPDVF